MMGSSRNVFHLLLRQETHVRQRGRHKEKQRCNAWQKIARDRPETANAGIIFTKSVRIIIIIINTSFTSASVKSNTPAHAPCAANLPFSVTALALSYTQ